MLGYTHPLPSACWDTPPTPSAAIAADGTHPTGMHTCFIYFFGAMYKLDQVVKVDPVSRKQSWLETDIRC